MRVLVIPLRRALRCRARFRGQSGFDQPLLRPIREGRDRYHVMLPRTRVSRGITSNPRGTEARLRYAFLTN